MLTYPPGMRARRGTGRGPKGRDALGRPRGAGRALPSGRSGALDAGVDHAQEHQPSSLQSREAGCALARRSITKKASQAQASMHRPAEQEREELRAGREAKDIRATAPGREDKALYRLMEGDSEKRRRRPGGRRRPIAEPPSGSRTSEWTGPKQPTGREAERAYAGHASGTESLIWGNEAETRHATLSCHAPPNSEERDQREGVRRE